MMAVTVHNTNNFELIMVQNSNKITNPLKEQSQWECSNKKKNNTKFIGNRCNKSWNSDIRTISCRSCVNFLTGQIALKSCHKDNTYFNNYQ